MIYVKVLNDEIVEYPISEEQIRNTFSNMSFPIGVELPIQFLKTKNIYPVIELDKPIDNTVVWEKVAQPILNGTQWELGWVSRQHTEEEQITIKDSLVVQLAALADVAEKSGVTYNGITIKSDSETQHKIMAASIKAKESLRDGTPFTPVKWRGVSLWYSLDAQMIVLLSDLLYDYVEGVFATRFEVEERINAGEITTDESLMAVWNEETNTMLMSLLNKYAL